MKRKKAALYDPYLDVLGGGEKHILSIFKVLEKLGYEISVFWDKDLNREIEAKFALRFQNRLNFIPNIFKGAHSPLEKLVKLSQLDLFFYVTDGSYFFSPAKKNFIFSMYPKKDLYNMKGLNGLKTLNYKFISNSQFTNKWLAAWGVSAYVLLPYLNDDFIGMNIKTLNKERIILSVGRFFNHLHAKQQPIIIDLFKKLNQRTGPLKDFKLILAGGLKQEDKQYFNKLKKMATNNPTIIFKPNLPYRQLLNLYKKARLFWHFTGFGVDEAKHPESVEHLGITPLEAMAAGCTTFCFAAGGPKEYIKDGRNGFLFRDEKELTNKLNNVFNNPKLESSVKVNAKRFVTDKFGFLAFEENVKKIITI